MMVDPRNVKQINAVMEFLGRSHQDGAIKGDNLTKILNYLINTKSEEYNKTCSRIALRVGIAQRYVKENYLYGLEGEGLINVYMNGNRKVWEWIGLEE